MDLHYLKIFNAAARNMNFSHTADELHISQPAVSLQIKKLEEGLGVQLFDRLGKHVFLTESGNILFEYTKKIFTLLDEAESKIEANRIAISGKINIGASDTPGIYILPEVLSSLRKKFPQIHPSMQINYPSVLFEMLSNNTMDIALVGGENKAEGDLTVEKVFEDELFVIMSPANPLSMNKVIRKEELAEQWFITHEEGSPIFELIQSFAMKSLGISMQIALTTDNTAAIKKAVMANLGIAILPLACMRQELVNNTLTVLRIEDYILKYPFNIVSNHNKYLTPAVAALIREIREFFSQYTYGKII